MGLDDIRPFNFRQRESIHAYANANTAKAIRRAFSYIWDAARRSAAASRSSSCTRSTSAFTHDGIEIIPIPVTHGDWTILGFRIGRFAYITDTNGIPRRSMKLLEGVDILALDGLRPGAARTRRTSRSPRPSTCAQEIGARETWLIHLAHEVEHEEVGGDAARRGAARV